MQSADILNKLKGKSDAFHVAEQNKKIEAKQHRITEQQVDAQQAEEVMKKDVAEEVDRLIASGNLEKAAENGQYTYKVRGVGFGTTEGVSFDELSKNAKALFNELQSRGFKPYIAADKGSAANSTNEYDNEYIYISWKKE